jgi:glycosyltransferase involved in cell wall biosynthesis
MKILQIINSLGTGGAEKLLLDTIPLYRKKGIEMDILVFWDNNLPFITSLKGMNCCKVIVLKESNNYKDIYSISNIWKLRKYMKEYDIAHVHLFPALYFVVLAKMFSFSKTRLVFTEHSTHNRRMDSKFLKFIDSLIYKKFKAIICITEEVLLVLRNHLTLSNVKYTVITNGVDINKYRNANSVLEDNQLKKKIELSKMIIQVSSFQEPKDQSTLIKALNYLPNTIKLVLVGDGISRKECEELVSLLNLQDRVIFLGQRMDIPSLLKMANIVVLSSKYEGLSLSSIEGMASGRPFVASDVPGLSEIVAGAGLLFEVGNAQDLATKIQTLLDNKSLYEETVKACQVRADQYDIHKMIDKHIALYESLK